MMAWLLILVGVLLLLVALFGAYATRRRGPADSQDKVNAIVDHFDIWDWPVFSWFKVRQIQSVSRQAVARTDLVSTVSDLESSRSILHERGMTAQKAAIDHENYLLDAALRNQLTGIAIQRGLDVSTLMALVQKEKFNELDIHRAAEEARIKIEAGLIYQLRNYHEVSMIGRRLDGLFEEIDAIQNGNESESVKRRKIAEREDDVRFLQEDRRVKRERLLQAHNREDDRRSNTTPIGGGHAGETVEGASNEASDTNLGAYD